jgi:alanine racemase
MDYLVRQGRHKRKVVILSDILQGGISEVDLYSEVSDILSGHNTDLLVGIGTSMEKYSGLFKMPVHFYRTAADFIQHLPELKIKNSDILIKGARPFGFETISARLQQKAHETVLEINLNALASNFNYLKSLLPAGTKTMAMVKAFSYGSGLLEIASHLRFLGVDYLAVAFADEGVELRQAGITLPVMVMSPEPDAFGAMISYSLEPEIYSFRMLSHFLNEARRVSVKDFPVHIKFDTGMKRLGFEAADVEELSAILNDQHYLRVKSVFSHLVAAEDAQEDEFTLSQVEKFQSIAGKLTDLLGYKPEMHLLNSAGMMRFPRFSFNMVRLGIGLYGIGPDDTEKLQNVVSLKTVISQIRKVPKGETVGYNRKGMVEKDSLIATIPLGYADGLSRRLGNGNAEFRIGNARVKTIGNVCMDMCMVDVTGLNVNEGDEVIVFNDQKSLLRLAKASETIPYEVLTGISRRVKRVYFHE